MDDDNDLMYTMTEQERRRLAREKEQEADLAVASDLMGAVDLGDGPYFRISGYVYGC